jgi:hypothetical protein
MVQMTMDCFNHYRRPYLAADKIEMLAHGKGVVLRQAERALELLVEGDVEAAKSTLELLCCPDSAAWGKMGERPDSDLSALVDALDRLGWLGEADQSGHTQVTSDRNMLHDLLLTATNWLVEAHNTLQASANGETEGARNYLTVLTHFSKEAGTLCQSRQGDHQSLTLSPFTPLGEDIATQALTLVLRAWKRTSPLNVRY